MFSIKKNNFKSFFLLIFLLAIFILYCAVSYVNAVSSDLQNSVFRLHVIANSDSVEDQNLKYSVRDSILEYMNTFLSSTSSKEESIKLVSENIDSIKQIARKTIIDNGYDYDVNVEVGNFQFPTKTYGDIHFPAGYYDALKVKIGKSEGKNWWCVMFPPLCFVDVTSGIVPEESKEILEESLLEDEYKLISSNDNSSKIKFKIIELFQDISSKISS